MTPKLHQSMVQLLMEIWLMISGAMQSGVPISLRFDFPQMPADLRFLFLLRSLTSSYICFDFYSFCWILNSDSPKSVSFRCPFLSITRLSGFKSRWIISNLCRCSMARMISARQNWAWSSSKYTQLFSICFKSPPGRYSSTNTCDSFSLKENGAITKWSPAIFLKISCSFLMVSIYFLPHYSLICMIFRAQISLVCFLRPKYTFPKAPCPRIFKMSKPK